MVSYDFVNLIKMNHKCKYKAVRNITFIYWNITILENMHAYTNYNNIYHRGTTMERTMEKN